MASSFLAPMRFFGKDETMEAMFPRFHLTSCRLSASVRLFIAPFTPGMAAPLTGPCRSFNGRLGSGLHRRLPDASHPIETWCVPKGHPLTDSLWRLLVSVIAFACIVFRNLRNVKGKNRIHQCAATVATMRMAKSASASVKRPMVGLSISNTATTWPSTKTGATSSLLLALSQAM